MLKRTAVAIMEQTLIYQSYKKKNSNNKNVRH